MKMFSSSSSKVHANMTCGLKVDTRSPGWEKTLNKVLKKFNGLRFMIDGEEGTAIITGRADPNKILKRFAKAGKHAEVCWVGAGNLQQSTNSMTSSSNGGYPYQHPGYAYPYSGYVDNGGGYYSNNYHQQGYQYSQRLPYYNTSWA